MSEQAIWEKLLKLKPALPQHAQVQQRYYGDELWYILYDKVSGKFHRFNAIAYALLGFMDGRNNLDQILALAGTRVKEKELGTPPEQGDLIELLQYLYVADLLVCDFTPSTEEMFNRNKRKKEQFWQQLFRNPYVWRFSFFNPDNLLERLLPLAKKIATPAMGVIWLALVAYVLLQVGNYWPELSQHSFNHILSPENLFLLWLIYPVLKVVHELGHGLFTKVWGGSVQEFGVVFVLGTPLPFVDATAATAFPKYQRLMVGAAGMAVEIFFACLAFIVWINVNDGLLRDVCFNLMLIGGVSTLFFNGNPLLKFDGYHILCDLIDQPNLAARSMQQIRYLVRHYGFNISSTLSPALNVSEGVGLTCYGVLSFLYRFVILVVIVVLVSKHFPTAGMILMAWLVFFQIVLPVAKYCVYLLLSDDLNKHRTRALTISFVVVSVLAYLVFLLPVDHKTSTQGVVWLPPDSRIHAEVAGEVVDYLVSDGQTVAHGQLIARLANHELVSEYQKKLAHLREYQSRYEETWSQDQTKTRLFEQDIQVIQTEIAALEKKVQSLEVRSPSSGVFKSVFHSEIIGSYIREGDTIGLLVNEETPTVRVALTQQEIGLIKLDTQGVEVKFSSRPKIHAQAKVSKQVPKATYVLPSPVLGTNGGGRIIVDAADEEGTRSIERIFVLDLELPAGTAHDHFYGMRAYVAFLHSPEVVYKQVLRRVRQAYISIIRND